jgi:hypothetical protein
MAIEYHVYIRPGEIMCREYLTVIDGVVRETTGEVPRDWRGRNLEDVRDMAAATGGRIDLRHRR